jgi:hypothetical protein
MQMTSFRKRLIAAALVGFSAHAGAQSQPQEPAYTPNLWRVEISPYTYHYSYNVEHRPVRLIGLERETPDRWFVGGAYFSNSFGQDSGYVYMGRSYYNVFESLPRVYLKWSAGLMYGYKDPYEDKVPLNYKGFSPAIVPAVGWRFNGGWNAQVNVLGAAALMFSLVKEL